jgi:predicted deacetylase
MDAESAFDWYNKDSAHNLVAQSWTRYDPLIAIPRLVDQFRNLDLLLEHGHEIALHGYPHE